MFSGTSLLAQWLRILLPIQGAQVQSLVFEDFTGHRAKKPICHNDWVCAPNYLSHSGSRARAPQQGSGLCWLQLQKGFTQQRRPSAAKKKSSHILHGHKLLTQNRWLIKFFVFLPLPHNCSWKCTLREFSFSQIPNTEIERMRQERNFWHYFLWLLHVYMNLSD